MSRILSLQGRSLKLDKRSDIEPYLRNVDPQKIEEVHFGGNTIGVDASYALAEFLQKATSIKVADFADIFTGRLITEIPEALTAICNALKDKTTLIEINLSDNAFGGRSVDPMVPFITENRSFQIFKLNNNGLGPAGGKVIADALLKSAELSKSEGKRSNLRTVICGRNRLEDGSASAWAEAFAAHGSLLEVRMPQNGIRQAGMSALAEGLSKNPGLKYLDLQDNTFTADGSVKGIELWAKSMSSWPEIETINFSDCVLSIDGEVPAILKEIAGGSNPKLKSLLLQNNNLEAESFSVLSDAIDGHLRGLKSLELQWNDIEEDDVHLENLRKALKARGGKLFVSDDDEEEEEEAEDEDGDEEKEETKATTESVRPATKAIPEPAQAKDGKKTHGDEKAVETVTDLMGKVSLGS